MYVPKKLLKCDKQIHLVPGQAACACDVLSISVPQHGNLAILAAPASHDICSRQYPNQLQSWFQESERSSVSVLLTTPFILQNLWQKWGTSYLS